MENLFKRFHRIEQHSLPEQLPTAEVITSRILTYQLNNPDDMLQLADPLRNCHLFKGNAVDFFNHALNWNNVPVTSVLLEEKNATAINPTQALLLGGSSRFLPEKGRWENADETAIRTLSMLELYGITPKHFSCVVSQRDHHHIHPTFQPDAETSPTAYRIQTHEAILEAEIAPFLTPTTYNPNIKLETILHLSPDEFETLLSKEQLAIEADTPYTVTLVDNLWTTPEHRVELYNKGAENDLIETERTKTQLIEHVYTKEARTRIELIDCLLSVSSRPDREKQQKKWERIRTIVPETGPLKIDRAKEFFRQYSSFLTHYETSYTANWMEHTDSMIKSRHRKERQELLDAGMDNRRLTQRYRLLSEIQWAWSQLRLERDIESAKHAGPQQPFLVMQHLIRAGKFPAERYDDEYGPTGEIGPHETRELFEIPVFEKILRAISYAFDIDISPKSTWYVSLLLALRDYRASKNDSIANRDEPEYISQYEKQRDWLYEGFAEQFEIPAADIDTRHITGALEFSHTIGQPLQGIVDEELHSRLLPLLTRQSEKRLDELVLTAFRIGKEPFHDHISEEECWIAWRTLLLMAVHIDAEQIKSKTPWENPFQYAWEHITTPVIDTNGQKLTKILPDISAIPLERCELKNPPLQTLPLEVPSPFGRQVHTLDLSEIPVQFLVAPREKTTFAIMRKMIERYDPKKGIHDIDGGMFIFDAEEFWRALLHSHQAERGASLILRASEIADRAGIRPNAKTYILDTIAKAAIAHCIAAYPEMLQQWGYMYSRIKPRATGTLVDLIPSDKNHEGSHASLGSKAQWEWLKYAEVAELTRITGRDNTYREEKRQPREKRSGIPILVRCRRKELMTHRLADEDFSLHMEVTVVYIRHFSFYMAYKEHIKSCCINNFNSQALFFRDGGRFDCHNGLKVHTFLFPAFGTLEDVEAVDDVICINIILFHIRPSLGIT